MRKPRVYLETTMFNYYFDSDRDAHASTVTLFQDILAMKYDGYTSIYVTDELGNATEPKRSNMLDLISKCKIKVLPATNEIGRLADIYIQEGIIPTTHRYDSLHISCATVNDLEYIFSLNFKHINRIKTKAMVGNVNIRYGYKPIIIASPLEVV